MESQGNVNRFEWTDTRITQLRTLVGLGLSGGQIANALGCTRNAVIGKMGRMGIKSKNAKGHQPGEPAPWKSIPKAPRPNMMTINAKSRANSFIPPRAPIEQPVQASSEPPPNARTFDELAPGECRWPFGDGTPYLFCAAPQLDGHSYCLGHCSIAHRPTPRRTTRERYEESA